MTSAPDQPARDAGDSPGSGGTPRTGAAVGTPPADTTGQARTTGQGSTTRQGDARQQVPRQAQAYEAGYRETGPSGATLGFTMLAAVLMMLSGVWAFFEGLAAIIRGSFFIVTRNYVYDMSAVGWGWIHLILGVLIAVAGVALLRDMLWARITGVVLASLITIANFLFIPYYPLWSIVIIALNMFVIWALLTPRRA
jgi:hypothetical protein